MTRRKILLALLSSPIAGCGALNFSSGPGGGCRGPECGKLTSNQNPDAIIIGREFFTKFSSSIRVPTDNFLARLRRAPSDPQLTQWILDFAQPAELVIAKIVDSNVTAIWLPLDSSGQFVLHINQTDWRETNSTVSSYRSFQRLSQVLDPARLRWRVDVAGAIRAIDDYTVLYKARVQIQIQTKRRNDDDWTRTQTFDDAISVAEFGQILFDQVFNAYVAFFRSRYQMKIVNSGV